MVPDCQGDPRQERQTLSGAISDTPRAISDKPRAIWINLGRSRGISREVSGAHTPPAEATTRSRTGGTRSRASCSGCGGERRSQRPKAAAAARQSMPGVAAAAVAARRVGCGPSGSELLCGMKPTDLRWWGMVDYRWESWMREKGMNRKQARAVMNLVVWVSDECST